MKIGIGISSYNRPEHLRFCLKQVIKHLLPSSTIVPIKHSGEFFEYHEDHGIDGNDYAFVVVNGCNSVSKAKNICLHQLRECDHIFLLDDDTIIKSDNWTGYFINSGLNHLLYMNNRYVPYKTNDAYTAYINSTGCFMYLTKEVIEKVGYFGSEYKGYGMEHAGYSQRIHRAGLTPEPFICLNETSQYIHSLDLDGPFEGFDVEHKPSLSYSEMSENLEHNRKVYETECTTGEIYKTFEP